MPPVGLKERKGCLTVVTAVLLATGGGLQGGKVMQVDSCWPITRICYSAFRHYEGDLNKGCWGPDALPPSGNTASHRFRALILTL